MPRALTISTTMAGSDCAKLRTDRRTPQQGWGAFWQSAARHRGVRRRQPLALGLALGEDVRALPPPHRRPCRLRSGPGLSLNPLSHETCLAHTQGTAKRRSPGGLRTLRRKTRGGGLLTVLLCTDREERRAAAQNSARLAAPRRAGRLPPSARPLCDDGRRWRERIAASAGVPKTQRRMRPTTTTRCASRARGRERHQRGQRVRRGWGRRRDAPARGKFLARQVARRPGRGRRPKFASAQLALASSLAARWRRRGGCGGGADAAASRCCPPHLHWGEASARAPARRTSSRGAHGSVWGVSRAVAGGCAVIFFLANEGCSGQVDGRANN